MCVSPQNYTDVTGSTSKTHVIPPRGHCTTSMDTRSVRSARKPQENPVDTPGCLAGDTSCSHDGGALLMVRVQAHDVVDQQGGERATTATDKNS